MTHIRRLLGMAAVAVGAALQGLSAPGYAAQQVPQLANTVVSINGSLEVQRENWTTFSQAPVGTALHYGDLVRLRPSSGSSIAEATVVCGDLTVIVLPVGIGDV